MPTRREVIKRITSRLTPLYGEREAQQIARIVICELGGLSFTDLTLSPDESLEIDTLESAIEELASGRPVQYVLGHTEFCGLDFRVREGVLIPRPETEELVQWIVCGNHLPDQSILDVGTGSGAIAITLAHLLPVARVTAVDLSPQALTIARENAQRLQTKVSFEEADALGELFPGERGRFDLIISNPPYIPERERTLMRPNVTEHEPSLALFVPDNDPLLFYRSIARNARRLLRPEGSLYFEIHEDFAEEISRMLVEEGFPTTEVRKDINDKNRMTCSRLNRK